MKCQARGLQHAGAFLISGTAGPCPTVSSGASPQRQARLQEGHEYLGIYKSIVRL